MKKILITLRVDKFQLHNELRDTLDQRWANLLSNLNIFPILIPNNLKNIDLILNEVDVDGAILTGGGDVYDDANGFLKRNQVENKIINFCYKFDKPVLGICRGMQAIQKFFNNEFQQVEDHVDKIHSIKFLKKPKISSLLKYKIVNSFHNYGSFCSSGDIEAVAVSDDKVIEAIKHKSKEIYGIMWHIERDENNLNIALETIKEIFGI